jgi:hypothetical protein
LDIISIESLIQEEQGRIGKSKQTNKKPIALLGKPLLGWRKPITRSSGVLLLNYTDDETP